MKLLLVTLFATLLAIPLYGVELTLEWDASPSTGVEGYEVYSRDYTGGYNYDNPICGTPSLSCTVSVPSDRQIAFVARAFGYGPYDLDGNRLTLWSGNSNEVIYTPTATPPEPPRSLIARILAAMLGFFERLLG